MKDAIERFISFTVFIVLTSNCLMSCDGHHEFPDTTMQRGDILCTDGEIVRYEDLQKRDKLPIAVVFHVNHDEKIPGTGYAVYLWDIGEKAFCDSLGIRQNTSADISGYDGNENTYAMFSSGMSPAAHAVFDIWRYGQSAYIPSVSEARLLYETKESVNTYISQCGGDLLPEAPDECWYWTSTEVSGQEGYKAWLFSLSSGALQETPKEQQHKVRPIITLYH